MYDSHVLEIEVIRRWMNRRLKGLSAPIICDAVKSGRPILNPTWFRSSFPNKFKMGI